MATHAKLSCAPRALAASMVFALSALLAPIPSQAILIDSLNAGELVISDGGLGIADGLGIVGGERELVSGINIFGEYSSNKGGNGRLSIVNLAGGVPSAEFFYRHLRR